MIGYKASWHNSFIFVIVLILCNGCTYNKMIETIRIVDITSNYHLQGDDGQSYGFAGLKPKPGCANDLRDYLSANISGKSIIFIKSKASSDQFNMGEIYVLGIEKEFFGEEDIFLNIKKPGEYKGFLNINLGWFRGAGKALGVNANALILRTGLVKYVKEFDVEYEELYLNLSNSSDIQKSCK